LIISPCVLTWSNPGLLMSGFGDSFLTPLLLQPAIEQKQEAGVFRIIETRGSLAVERQQPDLFWKPEYRFTLTPRLLQDFKAMCHFHQTSPDSHFTQERNLLGGRSQRRHHTRGFEADYHEERNHTRAPAGLRGRATCSSGAILRNCPVISFHLIEWSPFHRLASTPDAGMRAEHAHQGGAGV
jgi:hypothetical protein